MYKALDIAPQNYVNSAKTSLPWASSEGLKRILDLVLCWVTGSKYDFSCQPLTFEHV